MDENLEEVINYHAVLLEIFPHTSDQLINDIINIVEAENPFDSSEGKIENMINLLSGDGAQGPIPEQFTESNQSTKNGFLDDEYSILKSIFPDASPDFLWKFCRQYKGVFNIERVIDELSSNGYEKIEVDPISIWEQLKDTLPNADPSYLKKEANRLALLPHQSWDEFVQNAIENNDYPTMQDYLKHKDEHDEIALYTNHFNVDEFLERIPNPNETFTDPHRKLSLSDDADDSDIKFALTFLYNHYSFIRKKHIEQLFHWRNKNLVEICERLDKMSRAMRKPRPYEECGDTKNIALLQEIAYLKNRRLIKMVLKHKDEKYLLAKEEARKYNLLETCQCCFEDELIPEECYFCKKYCIFCKECVKTGVETIIGRGEMRFPCFSNCDSEFSLQTLQMVLPKKPFERLTQRIASEEVKQAKVEGLETCPFCDFAMVLPDIEKIFKCINQDCLIESCRECRQKSHIPLRCSEIEYDEDVRRRTYIENKMTEALTRTCYSCKKTFIKTSGCNKMTCGCGAKMCYICGAAINDYTHFGSGGCPLHTNDTEVNLQRIRHGVHLAKKELGNVEIKFDPSNNIEEFYRNS